MQYSRSNVVRIISEILAFSKGYSRDYTATRPIKKLEAFSTNVDTLNTTNGDEGWDTSTYSSRETNKVRSTTFFHPDKITIIDGNTGHVISVISLHTTDNVTLHNIGSKTPYSPPSWTSIKKNG